MEERRKFYRFKGPISLRYTLTKDKSKGKSRTENISREGFAFPIDRRLNKEEILKIEFEIPGDNIPVFAQGAVAWTKKNKQDKKGIFDVGVKLIDISRFDRARILNYAYNQWVKKILGAGNKVKGNLWK